MTFDTINNNFLLFFSGSYFLLLLLFCVVHGIHPSIQPSNFCHYLPCTLGRGEGGVGAYPSYVRATCYAQHAILNYLGYPGGKDKMLRTLNVSANKAGKSRTLTAAGTSEVNIT